MPATDNSFATRMAEFRKWLKDAGLDIALITDDDSVYYLTGYYGYLHMDFGRPTILAVPADGESVLITPSMELDMAEDAAVVDRIAGWNDGAGDEWRAELPGLLKAGKAGIEPDLMPPVVRNFIDTIVDAENLDDVTPIISRMRMVKSAEELAMARHAGEVGIAMMRAARETVADGVAEFEVALAINHAGTKKAAELLNAHYSDTRMSPLIHFLQIMGSGDEVHKPHHRASTRILRKGEPVIVCLCGVTNFHRFKLGFDRTFWIGEVADDAQAKVYETTLASQRAALDALKPGVTAESVHAAYADVIRDAGYDYPFRCGRATGFSFLESPQLVAGDKTVIESGMVFAVDGAVTVPKKFRSQVGDSFIVTDDGWEQITHHPKTLEGLIV